MNPFIKFVVPFHLLLSIWFFFGKALYPFISDEITTGSSITFFNQQVVIASLLVSPLVCILLPQYITFLLSLSLSLNKILLAESLCLKRNIHGQRWGQFSYETNGSYCRLYQSRICYGPSHQSSAQVWPPRWPFMCFTLPPFLLIVSFIHPSGNILRRFDLYGRTDFLAADSMGNLYVSAAGGQHVIKYNYNGTYSQTYACAWNGIRGDGWQSHRNPPLTSG